MLAQTLPQAMDVPAIYATVGRGPVRVVSPDRPAAREHPVEAFVAETLERTGRFVIRAEGSLAWTLVEVLRRHRDASAPGTAWVELLPSTTSELAELFSAATSSYLTEPQQNTNWHRFLCAAAEVFLRALAPDQLRRVVLYVAEDPLNRTVGWPDLFTFSIHDGRPANGAFVEVKSEKDSLSRAQREWIKVNEERFQIPFTLARVVRVGTLEPPRPRHWQEGGFHDRYWPDTVDGSLQRLRAAGQAELVGRWSQFYSRVEPAAEVLMGADVDEAVGEARRQAFRSVEDGLVADPAAINLALGLEQIPFVDSLWSQTAAACADLTRGSTFGDFNVRAVLLNAFKRIHYRHHESIYRSPLPNGVSDPAR